MTPSQAGNHWNPRAEQLAAYVDGELDAAAFERLRSWLADHPETSAELRAQQRLLHLWQTAEPAQPSAQQWASALDRVEKGIAATPPTLSLWQQPFFKLALLTVGTAAALLLALPSAPWRQAKEPLPAGQPARGVAVNETEMVRLRAAQNEKTAPKAAPAEDDLLEGLLADDFQWTNESSQRVKDPAKGEARGRRSTTGPSASDRQNAPRAP